MARAEAEHGHLWLWIQPVNDGLIGEEIKNIHQGRRFRTVNFRELAPGAGYR